MAAAARREDWPRTVAEFEAWHARQPERWEFIAGQPRLMAPASMKHSIIKGNLYAALRAALAGRPWRPLSDGPQILTEEISSIPAQVHSRAGDLWHERFVSGGALELDDPSLRLELGDIYAETDIAA